MQGLPCLALELYQACYQPYSQLFITCFDCLWKIFNIQLDSLCSPKCFLDNIITLRVKEYALESTFAYAIERLLLFKTNQPICNPKTNICSVYNL